MKFFLVGLLWISLFSGTQNPFRDFSGVLSGSDYDIEARQVAPAIQSVPGEAPKRVSYNRWLCFESRAVRLGCEEDVEGYSLQIYVEEWDHVFVLEEPGRYDRNKCLSLKNDWLSLMENQREVCFFAAYWPSVDHDDFEMSYWMVYGLKSKSGERIAPVYRDE